MQRAKRPNVSHVRLLRDERQQPQVILDAVRHEHDCGPSTEDHGAHGFVPLGRGNGSGIGEAVSRGKTRAPIRDGYVPAQRRTKITKRLRVVTSTEHEQACYGWDVMNERLGVRV